MADLKVHVLDHPLIQHKLAMIRDINTQPKDFRDLVEEVSMLMAYEVTRDLPLEDVQVQTPMATTTCQVTSGKALAIVPILRAGLGMVPGMLRLVPNAKVGHIGLYRDHDTLQPIEYYCKLPADATERRIIVCDPMLATGGSTVKAVDMIKARGVKNIKLMCLIAAPEGVAAVNKHHPDVEIFAAALDSHLNEHAYIVPGLGDAGDRLFGTK